MFVLWLLHQHWGNHKWLPQCWWSNLELYQWINPLDWWRIIMWPQQNKAQQNQAHTLGQILNQITAYNNLQIIWVWDPFYIELINSELKFNATEFCSQLKTRTTRTPAFWDTPNAPWLPILRIHIRSQDNKANLRDLIAATGLIISNWIKIVNFSTPVTVKFDGWPRKTIGHVFYTTSSFVYHFKSIGEFKLD